MRREEKREGGRRKGERERETMKERYSK